jgi:hypothetical protein
LTDRPQDHDPITANRFVMRGPVPRIHAFLIGKDVDGAALASEASGQRG